MKKLFSVAFIDINEVFDSVHILTLFSCLTALHIPYKFVIIFQLFFLIVIKLFHPHLGLFPCEKLSEDFIKAAVSVPLFLIFIRSTLVILSHLITSSLYSMLMTLFSLPLTKTSIDPSLRPTAPYLSSLIPLYIHILQLLQKKRQFMIFNRRKFAIALQVVLNNYSVKSFFFDCIGNCEEILSSLPSL